MKHLHDFKGFVNESYNAQEELNEAFKSKTLRTLAKSYKGLQKAFFDALSRAGIAASDIDDSQISQMTPAEAAKATKQDPEKLFIYYSSTDKQNPYASTDYWNKNVQADTVLALVRGGKYQGLEYDRWNSKRGGKAMYQMVNSPDGNIGIDKSRGNYGSNLTSLKRMADVTDVVYVIDPNAAPSSSATRAERVEARKDATAFLSDKDFKKANQDRYQQILKDSAAKLPIAKMVEKAIDTLTSHIKDGISSGNKTKYGEVLIGNDSKGREIKMSDAASIMRNILDAFDKYAEYTNRSEGEGGSYYKEEAKEYAKRVKDYSDKIDKMNYAW